MMKTNKIAEHVAKLSSEAQRDMFAGRWDAVMTDALYAACGAETIDEMREARNVAAQFANNIGNNPRSQITRSQDRYLRTGQPNQFRVRGENENWWVEGTDNNNVWVDAEPGNRYASKADAMDAALDLAAMKDGQVID